jgi:hypothetical protein
MAGLLSTVLFIASARYCQQRQCEMCKGRNASGPSAAVLKHAWGAHRAEKNSLQFFVIPSKVMKLRSDALCVLLVVRKAGKSSDRECDTKSRGKPSA